MQNITEGKISFNLPVKVQNEIPNIDASLESKESFGKFSGKIGLFDKFIRLPSSEYAPAELPRHNLEGSPSSLVIILKPDTDYPTTYNTPSLENHYLTRAGAQLKDNAKVLEIRILVHPLTLRSSNLNYREFNSVINAKLMTYLETIYISNINEEVVYNQYFNENISQYDKNSLLIRVTPVK